MLYAIRSATPTTPPHDAVVGSACREGISLENVQHVRSKGWCFLDLHAGALQLQRADGVRTRDSRF
eukprot:1499003-Prymnesium_polylepis.1